MISAYIGIGANQGDARASVMRAIADLGAIRNTRMRASSSLFRTAPVDAHGDDYVNAVICIDTMLSADDLLTELQNLEHAAGRERPYLNAPRTLDLDLLLYGQQQIRSERMTVPHPRMTQRAFVLIPLLQIDAFISIPGAGPAHAFVPSVSGQAIQRIAD